MWSATPSGAPSAPGGMHDGLKARAIWVGGRERRQSEVAASRCSQQRCGPTGSDTRIITSHAGHALTLFHAVLMTCLMSASTTASCTSRRSSRWWAPSSGAVGSRAGGQLAKQLVAVEKSCPRLVDGSSLSCCTHIHRTQRTHWPGLPCPTWHHSTSCRRLVAGAARAHALPMARLARAKPTPCRRCRCGLPATSSASCSSPTSRGCCCTSGGQAEHRPWAVNPFCALATCRLPNAGPSPHVFDVMCPPAPLYCSCYEIYGGKVFDLLNGRRKLDVREDGRRRVQVGGCCAAPAGVGR